MAGDAELAAGLGDLPVANGHNPVVAGVVLTHHTAELAGRRMELGLAVDSEELLTIDSRILGGSIAEKLFHDLNWSDLDLSSGYWKMLARTWKSSSRRCAG